MVAQWWEHAGEPFNITSRSGESFANAKDMCDTAEDWLSDTLKNPSQILQNNSECPFTVASLRHNFAIFSV